MNKQPGTARGRQKERPGARLRRRTLGILLEIAFSLLLIAIGFVIAVAVTGGRL